MAEIESTIADFAREHRQNPDLELPPIDGARALLKVRLAEVAAKPRPDLGLGIFRFAEVARVAAYLCVTVMITVVITGLIVRHRKTTSQRAEAFAFGGYVVPNRSLTPGATRQVALRDVCAMAHEEVVKDVPALLRRQVFAEYGIANADAANYEVDYLIAPGLGGIDDIRNLWPEPNASPVWNSRVKDALEERLHQLVCSGTVDLPTAQRDIATDWIAAYRKYFLSDKPLPPGSDRVRFFGAFFLSSQPVYPVGFDQRVLR
jgi:hypothetical protein